MPTTLSLIFLRTIPILHQNQLNSVRLNRKIVKKGDPSLQKGKIKKGFIPGADMDDPNEKGMTKEQKEAYRAGKRREGKNEQTTIDINTR